MLCNIIYGESYKVSCIVSSSVNETSGRGSTTSCAANELEIFGRADSWIVANNCSELVAHREEEHKCLRTPRARPNDAICECDTTV